MVLLAIVFAHCQEIERLSGISGNEALAFASVPQLLWIILWIKDD